MARVHSAKEASAAKADEEVTTAASRESPSAERAEKTPAEDSKRQQNSVDLDLDPMAQLPQGITAIGSKSRPGGISYRVSLTGKKYDSLEMACEAVTHETEKAAMRKSKQQADRSPEVAMATEDAAAVRAAEEAAAARAAAEAQLSSLPEIAAWRVAYKADGKIPPSMKAHCKQHGIDKKVAITTLNQSAPPPPPLKEAAAAPAKAAEVATTAKAT